MSEKYILRADKICKSFPGVKALDHVQLDIEKGKVHAIMGENGAGKSTLMNILIGMFAQDSGEITFQGKPVRFNSVNDSLQAGLSMIHQELMSFPELSVAENIFMGNEPASRITGWIDKNKMNNDARIIMERLGVQMKVTRQMKELSIAEMQIVEIAKAISYNAKVVIMDEPTSAITEREINFLFDIISDLKKREVAIIYISHKMDEIWKIADTITVMRDGKYITTREKSDLDNDRLISLIVGRELTSVFPVGKRVAGDILLSVAGLTGAKFTDINFIVRRGEVVGMAGLMGSGRTEIANTIFGLEKPYKGDIYVKGRKVNIASPVRAIKSGLGLVSEDRKKYGLNLKSSVKKNISLTGLKDFSKGLFLNFRKEEILVREQIKKLSIKTPSPEQPVNLLSGGNQQKVVIAKVLLNDPDIIILDEPTRGIDIGAKAEIYALISRLANEGKAIILISSELSEIVGLSDRILVIRGGRIKAEFQKEDATQELIMKYAMS
ncbi:MAG: sugar ABC transporter ATP-binding protein [Chitinophagaceae bacterium]